jgi:hypothetical protein
MELKQRSDHTMRPTSADQEPRWPAMLAILVVGLLYSALPNYLSVGPRWLLIVLVSALEIPTILAARRQWIRAHNTLGLVICVLGTLFLLLSLALLILALPTHKENPVDLLRSAVALWLANVIIFAFWFWRLDAGGPYGRDQAPGHTEGAFLFPQMAEPERFPGWSPRFLDYLFIAFNNSTAFSPTDAPVLSRWAKVLTMVQSLVSLTIVILLAARAVNIL